MKNARSILSHLCCQPQFKSLSQYACYQKFIGLLAPKFQQAIAFVYIDKSTLFVALSHPGYKMELDYNKNLLKSLLVMLSKHDPQCSHLRAEHIVIFNSRFSVQPQEDLHGTDPKYHEIARGDFEICTEDEELQKRFEMIKKDILINKEIQ